MFFVVYIKNISKFVDMEQGNKTVIGMPIKESAPVTFERTQTYLDLRDNVVRVNVYYTQDGEPLSDFIKEFAEETNKMKVISETVKPFKGQERLISIG